MGYVVTVSVKPEARNDGISWTEVDWLESEYEDGTFSQIDTSSISPDTDPRTPQVRVLTTSEAAFATGWYKIRFRDASAGEWTSDSLQKMQSPYIATENQWFSYEDLLTERPHIRKLQQASEEWVNRVVIPEMVRYVVNYVGGAFQDVDKETLLGIAKNLVVSRVLGSDENIEIARARGQSSFTVAGDTVTIDLSRNPFLSVGDQSILDNIVERYAKGVGSGKLVTRARGLAYENAPGGDLKDEGDSEYVRSSGRPSYFGGQ